VSIISKETKVIQFSSALVEERAEARVKRLITKTAQYTNTNNAKKVNRTHKNE
jgi:hypothetical protein